MQSGTYCNRIDFLYHKKIVDTIKFPPVIANFQYGYVKLLERKFYLHVLNISEIYPALALCTPQGCMMALLHLLQEHR